MERMNEWIRDLIMCPSQIYYYFENPETNKKYCIYLRWRWGDPWSAELVEQTEDWYFKNNDWEPLNIGYYTHDEYLKLEKEVLEIVKNRFPNIDFKN